MSKGLIWLCLALGNLVLAQPAAAKVIRCDVCTADVDFRREAELAGAGTHLVYNLPDNVVQQWYVPTGSGGKYPPRATSPTRSSAGAGEGTLKQAPPPGASEELRREHALYLNGGSTLKPIIVVPVVKLGLNPSVVDKTAYDFVLDYNMRAMVESAAGSTDVIASAAGTDVVTAMEDLMSRGPGYLDLKEQARLPFKIVFKDGSSVIITVDMDHANGRYESGSARTAAGQLVPGNVQQTVGVWTNHGGDDLNRMADQLRRLGKTVTMAGSAHAVIRKISCTPDGCIAGDPK